MYFKKSEGKVKIIEGNSVFELHIITYTHYLHTFGYLFLKSTF